MNRPLRPLIGLSGDADPDVRGLAAAMLYDFGPRGAEAAPALEKLLKDQDRDNRRMATVALWQIGSPGVRSSLLLELVEKKPWLVRYDPNAVRDLGPEAVRLVPWLRRLLRHDDRSIYQDAAALLRQIDPKAADRAGVP